MHDKPRTETLVCTASLSGRAIASDRRFVHFVGSNKKNCGILQFFCVTKSNNTGPRVSALAIRHGTPPRRFHEPRDGYSTATGVRRAGSEGTFSVGYTPRRRRELWKVKFGSPLGRMGQCELFFPHRLTSSSPSSHPPNTGPRAPHPPDASVRAGRYPGCWSARSGAR